MYKVISDAFCNTNFGVSVPTLIFLFSTLLLSTVGQAAEPVGILKFARGDVTIESASGETRKAAKGDSLMESELIVTGATGISVIRLNDDSRMTLRPNSEFRVNLLDTAYESSDTSKQSSAILNLLRGGLRLVTGLVGKINPVGYRLKTPIATIGIRGTEFNTRICTSDCAAEEMQLAGSDAAAKIKEGLYVNVDDGQIFVENDAAGEPLDILQGESGYVADLTSLPVKLSLVPAFQALDKIPSPSQLDFDNIQISDDALQAIESAAEVAVVAAVPASDTEGAVVAAVPASDAQAAATGISGTYEIDLTYGKDLPLSERKWHFGNSPDIEFNLIQKGDKIIGKFSGDRDGTIEGKIVDKEVTFDFLLEAKGGETKYGTGTWIVQDDGSLVGDFKIRGQHSGIVRVRATLTKTDSSSGGFFALDVLFILIMLMLSVHLARLKRRKPLPLK